MPDYATYRVSEESLNCLVGIRGAVIAVILTERPPFPYIPIRKRIAIHGLAAAYSNNLKAVYKAKLL